MKTFIVISAIVVAVLGSFADDINWKDFKQADFLLKGLNSGAPFPDVSIQGRIFGANVAAPHQFPYQVAMMLVQNNGYQEETILCGGSLISRDFVLTAAHCAIGVSRAGVFLGAQNLNKPEESHPMIVVSSDNIYVHPFYVPLTSTNDVALIRLPAPVVLNDSIQTIKLPRSSMLQPQLEGHMVLMTGWGKTGDSGNPSNELRYANLRVLPERTCAVTFPHLFHNSQVCVSGNVHSVCPGDSGGPLVAQEADGTNVVVGIASFIRNEGCEKGFPTVFTRVTSFLDWISLMTGIEIRK